VWKDTPWLRDSLTGSANWTNRFRPNRGSGNSITFVYYCFQWNSYILDSGTAYFHEYNCIRVNGFAWTIKLTGVTSLRWSANAKLDWQFEVWLGSSIVSLISPCTYDTFTWETDCDFKIFSNINNPVFFLTMTVLQDCPFFYCAAAAAAGLAALAAAGVKV
jgi:hypothetical protein